MKANVSVGGQNLSTRALRGNGQSPDSSRDNRAWEGPWESQRILSLDGEGTEGLFALFILEELMNVIGRIEEKSSPPAFWSTSSPLFKAMREGAKTSGRGAALTLDSPLNQRYRPCHYFDFISGTSSGGLSAIMLGRLKLSVTEALEVGQQVLTGLNRWKRKTNSKRLQILLIERLGNPTSIAPLLEDEMDSRYFEKTAPSWPGRATLEGDADGCRTLVFTTSKAARGIRQPYVFRSYRQTGQTGWNTQSQTCDISVVDACRASLASPIWFESVKIPGFGRFRDGSLLDINPALETYHELRDIRRDSRESIQCVLSIGTRRSIAPDPMEERALSRRGFRYLRLSVDPEVDRPKVEEVQAQAREYIERVRTQLEEWAHFLVALRRQRAQTVKWSRYAGLRLPCPFCMQSFARGDLILHLRTKHYGYHSQDDKSLAKRRQGQAFDALMLLLMDR